MSLALYPLVKTIPVAILIIAASCSSQKVLNEKSGKEYRHNRDIHFKGNVKSVFDFNFKRNPADSGFSGYVSKEYYKFDRAGNLLEKVVFQRDGKFGWRSVYRYNRAGYYIEWRSFAEDSSLISRQTFQFDKKGNMTKTIKYRGADSLIKTEKLYYDEHGSVVELCREPDIFHIYNTYTYDSLNRPIIKERREEFTFKRREKLNIERRTNKYRVTYKYSGDTLVETRCRDNYEECFISVWNKNNRLLMLKGLDSNKKPFEETYNYDSLGNEIEHKEVKAAVIDDNRSYRCEYLYDVMGNWIKKTITRLDGRPVSSVERKIEYY